MAETETYLIDNILRAAEFRCVDRWPGKEPRWQQFRDPPMFEREALRVVVEQLEMAKRLKYGPAGELARPPGRAR